MASTIAASTVKTPAAVCVQVHTAGVCRLCLDIARPDRHGNAGRGVVLVQIADLQHRSDDLSNASFVENPDILGGDPVRLRPASLAHMDGVRQQRAFRLVDGDRAELHAALLRSAPTSPRERKTWTICARIDTAISWGLIAPIASPIGA